MYAELHCHSVFSLLDGASEPEALVARAKALGYPALALTDHNDLGGAVRFAQAATELGVGGIIGTELTVDVGGRLGTGDRALTHLVLLAQTREGYGNVSALITRARMDRPRGAPAVSLDTLARHAPGVFALTGCLRGWVPTLVAAGDMDGACEAAAALKDIFGGRLAIECWDHHLPEEREVVRQLIPLARSLGIPWVVTNDVHYAHPTGRLTHDVLASIKHQETLDGMGTRLRPNGEWYLKSVAQLRRRWQHDETGLRASLSIAEQCTFRLADLQPTLPGFPLPPGVTADEYLTRLVEQGAVERWGQRIGGGRNETVTGSGPAHRTIDVGGGPPAGWRRVVSIDDLPETYRTQIAHELDIIRRLGLAGYFLIVWDIIRFAHREGVLCQGRGSAANSAVCYCLGITAVDPIGLKLLFERFLSEERREPPDIDIDFAHRDREKVLQYVYERYGREHAAMVCEHITYRGRSAVRDAARVLGFSGEQADVLSAFSDRFSAKATAEALRGGASPEEMTARKVDIDPQSDRPADPNDARREPDAWSAEVLLADRLGQGMVRGTEATTRMREAKDAARKQTKEVGARDAAARSGRPELTRKRAVSERLTSADRPKPNAAYEPYGSPNARSVRGPSSQLRAPNDTPLGPDADLRPPTSDLPSVLFHAGLDPNDRRVQALPAIVAGLHNAPRHRSIHVGGFVLTAEPLSTVVPIEPASMPGRTVIQWERDDLDPVGLVKIDLLGLGMLTVLQDCLKYIRATRGQTIDLGQLDMSDQAVYDDICAADTIGVFQVESRAQMNTLPRLKPRNFYDLVVEVAIIRPGPIQGEMVHPFLRRRAGEEEVTYPHPAMAPILDRTLGVPLFQEQGMQVAIALAGFTPGEADNLRRAMGHKRSRERMAAICEKLIAGMKKNGIDDDVARRIYNQINAFADYGFPESHAASFALIVYASAYLRHYFAPEFTAAILNAQPMGFYSVGTLIEDARRHGVIVNPVDLTKSRWDHTLENENENENETEMDRGSETSDQRSCLAQRARPQSSSRSQSRSRSQPAVRLGLRLVKGLGHAARAELDRALADGPFAGIDDVVGRVKLDERSFRALAEAGAFDSMVPDVAKGERRRVALWRVLDAVRGDAGPLAPRRVIPNAEQPKLPTMSPLEITDADYRMTSLSLNGHPLRHLRKVLAPNGIRTARDILTSGRDGERVAHAGLVICRQRPGTAKGFVFLSLEDETGIVNVVVTPKRFERQALMISTSPLILVRGTLQVEQTVVNLRGESFQALRADAGEQWAKGHNFH